jgi:hypothetical protein
LDSESAFAALLAVADCSFADFADLAGFEVGSPVVGAGFVLPVAGFLAAGDDSVLTVCWFRYPLYPCFVLCLYGGGCFFPDF